MNSNVHLSMSSANGKTGRIPVTSSPRSTCPDCCPLSGAGCYGDNYPLMYHWRAVDNGRGQSYAETLALVETFRPGQLWRHNQVGDLQGDGSTISPAALIDLVAANLGKRGFTYTHYPDTPENVELIRLACEHGFTINLSANNLNHADQLSKHNLPLVVVLPENQTTNTTTPEGLPVIVCPAVTHGITCDNCGLCYELGRPAIGFPVHGARRKIAAQSTGVNAT